MAQIGWVEVTSESGEAGYLWYLKSQHETRLRFDDYLEMAMVEGIPADPVVSGVNALGSYHRYGCCTLGSQGTEGMFYTIETWRKRLFWW